MDMDSYHSTCWVTLVHTENKRLDCGFSIFPFLIKSFGFLHHEGSRCGIGCTDLNNFLDNISTGNSAKNSFLFSGWDDKSSKLSILNIINADVGDKFDSCKYNLLLLFSWFGFFSMYNNALPVIDHFSLRLPWGCQVWPVILVIWNCYVCLMLMHLP